LSALNGTLLGYKLPDNVLACEVLDDPDNFSKVVRWITNARSSDLRRYTRTTDVHSMAFDGTEEGARAVIVAMKLTD
jgi:hypothetical protein